MILEQLNKKLVEYSKEKQTDKLGVLRFFLAAVKNKEIELRPSGKELDDDIIFKVLKKQVKNLDETVEICQKAGPTRQEALNKALTEKKILEEFAMWFPKEVIDRNSVQYQPGSRPSH